MVSLRNLAVSVTLDTSTFERSFEAIREYLNQEREEQNEGHDEDHESEGRREDGVGHGDPGYRGRCRCALYPTTVDGSSGFRNFRGNETPEGVRPERGDGCGDPADGGGLEDWYQEHIRRGATITHTDMDDSEELEVEYPTSRITWARYSGSEWHRIEEWNAVQMRHPSGGWQDLSSIRRDASGRVVEVNPYRREGGLVADVDSGDVIPAWCHPERRGRLLEYWDTADIVFANSWSAISVEAEKRAEELLLEHLDEVQTLAWADTRAFTVHGSNGGVYTIGRTGGVIRRPGETYCLQPKGRVPDADACLARKLLLETDEEEFLSRANNIFSEEMWRRI